MLLRTDLLVGNLVNNKTPPTPPFFVNVDSKGVSVSVSALESTLAGFPVSVDSKGIGG
jgi:hypothetical protein